MERLPKGSLWGLGMLFNCLSAILGCTADGQQQFERDEYPVIKLSDRAVEILPGTGALKALGFSTTPGDPPDPGTKR